MLKDETLQEGRTAWLRHRKRTVIRLDSLKNNPQPQFGGKNGVLKLKRSRRRLDALVDSANAAA